MEYLIIISIILFLLYTFLREGIRATLKLLFVFALYVITFFNWGDIMGVIACTILWINFIIIRAGIDSLSEDEKQAAWNKLKPELTSQQIDSTKTN